MLQIGLVIIYYSRNYKRPIASIYLQNYIKYSELGRTLKYICNKKTPPYENSLHPNKLFYWLSSI